MPAETVAIATTEAPGYYGKLPAKGDFVTRRLSRAFIKAWDDWLQDAIVASRETIGSPWLDIYLTSPIWRFALEAGVCGPATVAGVLMPSVDKVGRYFPLTIGVELPARIDLAELATQAQGWYQAIEDLALATLADEFLLEELDRPIPLTLDATSPVADGDEMSRARCYHLEVEPAPASSTLKEAQGVTQARGTRWWTSGSQRVAPCLLICPSLPPPAAFASMLDGVWEGRGWEPLTVAVEATIDEASGEPVNPPEEPVPPQP